MKAPCKDCPNWHPNCHSECEKYKEFRNYRDELNKLNREQGEGRYFRRIRIEQFRKAKKRGK